MDTIQPKQPLLAPAGTQGATNFSLLPEAIRTWLTSDLVVNSIIELNKRLSTRGGKIRIVPKMITRLVVGIIKPEQFVEELKNELQIPPEDVKKISAEIKGSILRPIAAALKNTQNIDIDKIPVEEIKPATPVPSVEIAAEKKPEPLAWMSPVKSTNNELNPNQRMNAGKPIVSPEKKSATTADVKKPESAPLRTTDYALPATHKPFMLHEEKPVAPLPQMGNARESFSFHVPEQQKPITQKPVAAQFTSPFDQASQKPEPAQSASVSEMPKIIHYSGLKTPLDEFGKPVLPKNNN